ncbi:MAG: hypothetical protein E6713_10280 [Sporomusaceae bacterium]|nr:hypothetical protein [Sporomusaceae bacterium]
MFVMEAYAQEEIMAQEVAKEILDKDQEELLEEQKWLDFELGLFAEH